MTSVRDIAFTAGTVFNGTGLAVMVSSFFLTIAGSALASIALVVWLAFAIAAKL